jgi:hypothetical protein
LPSFAVLTISQVVSASFGVFRWLDLLCFFTIFAVCWFFFVFCCIFNRFMGIIYSLNGFDLFTVILRDLHDFLPVMALFRFFYDLNRFTGFSRIFNGFGRLSVFFSCFTRFSPVYGFSDDFTMCGVV